MKKRDPRADVRWGARMGLLLTGILILPAGVVAASTSLEAFTAYCRLLVLYLLFGSVAGCLAGYLRPFCRREVGAALTGSAIGIAYILMLFLTPGSEGAPPSRTLVVAAIVIGGILGALLGAYMFQRSKVWTARK